MVEALLKDPAKLQDLDIQVLDEYLTKNFNQKKTLTLQDLKNELNNPFFDFRKYEDPSVGVVFNCLTGTTPAVLNIGHPVQVRLDIQVI